jgi:hypothetical protein
VNGHTREGNKPILEEPSSKRLGFPRVVRSRMHSWPTELTLRLFRVQLLVPSWISPFSSDQPSLPEVITSMSPAKLGEREE